MSHKLNTNLLFWHWNKCWETENNQCQCLVLKCLQTWDCLSRSFTSPTSFLLRAANDPSVFSWLKVPTSAFAFKTLHAKRAHSRRLSVIVKTSPNNRLQLYSCFTLSMAHYSNISVGQGQKLCLLSQDFMLWHSNVDFPSLNGLKSVDSERVHHFLHSK